MALFVWAHRAPNRPKRRFPARVVLYPARRVKTTRQVLSSRVASGQLSQKEADAILSKVGFSHIVVSEIAIGLLHL